MSDCTHPISMLSYRVDTISEAGGCETCGFGSHKTAEVTFRCKCGHTVKIQSEYEDGHDEWHSFVAETSR